MKQLSESEAEGGPDADSEDQATLHVLSFSIRKRKYRSCSSYPEHWGCSGLLAETAVIHLLPLEWNQDPGFIKQHQSSPGVSWRKFNMESRRPTWEEPRRPPPAPAYCSARCPPSPMAPLPRVAGPRRWRGHSSLNQGRAPRGPSHPTARASSAPLMESSQVTGERKVTNIQELRKGRPAPSWGRETDNGATGLFASSG